MLEQLGTLASLALAGSLAVERLVVIAKTLIPKLTEATRVPGMSEMRADRNRRLAVLGITMIASIVTAFLVTTGELGGQWFERYIEIGEGRRLGWLPFALMISGGSAFWTSIVAFASAAKDVRAEERKQLERSGAGAAQGQNILPVRSVVVAEL